MEKGVQGAILQRDKETYAEQGKKRERTARFVERVGIEQIKSAVL